MIEFEGLQIGERGMISLFHIHMRFIYVIVFLIILNDS